MFCEYTGGPDGLKCRARAMWLIGVGTRQTDRQLSCSKHLAMTCTAMAEAEKPRTALLVVKPVTREEKV